MAPEIAAIQGVTPQPQQTNLSASPFPQSLVNIVNPPGAPDPTGLAAALNVLGTPNIFRDMSGRAEVSDLLKKLSDNSISIAQAANRAKEIQAKYGDGSQSGKNGGGSGTGGSGSTGAGKNRPSPSEQQRQLQVFKDAAKDEIITGPQSQQMAHKYLQNVVEPVSKPMVAFGFGGEGYLIGPFSDMYPDPIRPDDNKLQTAVDDAITHERQVFPNLPNPLKVAFAIVAIEGYGPEHPVAHHDGGTMHFSGSLLKYAVMYAAFELRAAVKRLAKNIVVKTPKELFEEIRTQFNQHIERAVELLSQDDRMKPEMLVPNYEQVFAAKPKQDEFELSFNPTFRNAMKQMLNLSNNFSAKHCIHALSYGWINGALQQGGFFREKTTGIWLAGDYSEEREWPAVRVDTENDGPVGQAMTCLEAARLYTLLHDKKLVNDQESTEMLKLLADVVAHPAHEVFIDRTPGLSFKFTHNKLGVANLKKENGGFSVASEASIVKHTASGREFVVVWQNHKWGGNASLRPISHIVDKTIKNYLAL